MCVSPSNKSGFEPCSIALSCARSPSMTRGGYPGLVQGVTGLSRVGYEGDFLGMETQKLDQKLMAVPRSWRTGEVLSGDAHHPSQGCPLSAL